MASRRELLGLGFDDESIRRRVRSGRWRRILPHTYLTVDTLTWTDRLTAALAFAGPASMLSGSAALAGLLRCVARPRTVLVLVPYESAPRSVGWVHVRRAVHLPRTDPRWQPRRAIAARAVADLGVELGRLDEVRALVTEAIGEGLATADQLREAVEHGPRRGSKHIRQAIEEAAGGAWSAPEARAAAVLREGGLPPFYQNVAITLPNGRRVVTDFLWEDLMAVLEIDSIEHHGRPLDRMATDERHAVLEACGYSVLHFTPRYVFTRPLEFTDRVRSWLLARAAR